MRAIIITILWSMAALVALSSCDNQPREREFRPIEPRYRTRDFRPIELNDHIDLAMSVIKRYEGFRSKPYRCQAGVLTIGYGETSPEIVDRESITKEEATALLRKRVLDIDRELNWRINKPLSPAKRAALISFQYNLGAGNLNNIAKRINGGNIDEAAQAILLYDKCKGKRLRGLTLRRNEEYRLFSM